MSFRNDRKFDGSGPKWCDHKGFCDSISLCSAEWKSPAARILTAGAELLGSAVRTKPRGHAGQPSSSSQPEVPKRAVSCMIRTVHTF